MSLKETLLTMVLDCGAKKAAVITSEDVKVSAEFRKSCELNQCGAYNKNWACPPSIGPIDELIGKVKSYPYGVLYQNIYNIEDSFDIEGMNEAAISHETIALNINDKLAVGAAGEDYLHLSAGGCRRCKVCAKVTDKPCRFPKDVLYPMEGYGVDVYNTSKATQLKYINGQNTVTYFGLILFKELS